MDRYRSAREALRAFTGLALRQQADLRRSRHAVLEQQPVPEHLELFLGQLPRHARMVRLLDLETRVQQAVHQSTVVRDEQQALRVVVEAADRIDALADLRQQVEYRAAPAVVLRRREIPLRLVEQQVDVLLLSRDFLAVDQYRVRRRVDLRAELAHNLAVNPDAALQDHLLRRAPRGDAGLADDLLQAFLLHHALILSPVTAGSSRPSGRTSGA